MRKPSTFSAPCTVLNNGILLEYDNVITGFNLGDCIGWLTSLCCRCPLFCVAIFIDLIQGLVFGHESFSPLD